MTAEARAGNPLPARRPTRPGLLPSTAPDTERMDAATAELAASLEEARQSTEKVHRFVDDIGSDRISTDGVVLDPFEEEDTVVRHVMDAIRTLGA